MRTATIVTALKASTPPWGARVYTNKPDAVRLPLVLVYPLSRIPANSYAKPTAIEFYHKTQFQVELYTKVESAIDESAILTRLQTLAGAITVMGAVYMHDSDVLRTIYTVVTTGG